MKEILFEHLLKEGSCEVKTYYGHTTKISLRCIENKETCVSSKPQFELGLMYNSSFQHTLQTHPGQTHVDIHIYPPNIEPGGLIPSVAEMADYTIAGNYISIRIYTH